MPTGMQTSSGSAGNSNQDASGFMAKMKSLFGGGDQGQADAANNGDPWAAEEAAAAVQAEANKPKTLDDYKELFTPKADPNKPAERADPFAAVNKENLASAAANIDFSSSVDEATMTAALGGDQAAMRKAINMATQASFTEAMSASNTLMQKRINDTVTHQVEALVAARLQDFDVNKELSSNPLLSNPATKPLRDMLSTNIRAANPGISASDLNKQLTGYLTTVAASFNPNAPTAGKAARLQNKALSEAANF
jgi:hypothetical protein